MDTFRTPSSISIDLAIRNGWVAHAIGQFIGRVALVAHIDVAVDSAPLRYASVVDYLKTIIARSAD